MGLSDVIALKRALSSWAHRLSWPVVRAYFEPLLSSISLGSPLLRSFCFNKTIYTMFIG
jgi:hypothetical protein